MPGGLMTYPPAPFDVAKNHSTLGLIADDEHGLTSTTHRRNSPWSSMTERFSQGTRSLLSLFLSILLNVVLATYFLNLLSRRGNSIVWRGTPPKYSQLSPTYFSSIISQRRD